MEVFVGGSLQERVVVCYGIYNYGLDVGNACLVSN